MTHRNPIPKLPRGAVAAIARVSGVSRITIRRALGGRQPCGTLDALILSNACEQMGIPTISRQWEKPSYFALRALIRDHWHQVVMPSVAPMPVRIFLEGPHCYGTMPERYPDCAHYDDCLTQFCGLYGQPEGIFGCRGCTDYSPQEHPCIDPGEEKSRCYALLACLFNRQTTPAEALRKIVRSDLHRREELNRRNIRWRRSDYGRVALKLERRGSSMRLFCEAAGVNPDSARRWIKKHFSGQNISDAGKAFVRSVLSETGTGEDDERAAHQ